MIELLAWLREHLSAGGAAAAGLGFAFLAWLKAGGWAAMLRWWRQYRETVRAASLARREELVEEARESVRREAQQLVINMANELRRLDQRIERCETRHADCEARVEAAEEKIRYLEHQCGACPGRLGPEVS